MTDHYFTNSEQSGRNRQTTAATIWGTEYSLITASGVFARSGLDIATDALLRTCEPPVEAKRLADVGCGYGPIAIALADHCPDAIVDAIDVNDAALQLCQENAAAADVSDRVRPMRPEQADPHQRYDEIWSNPPIRIGKPALHELLLEWLPRLADGGVMRMVVGKKFGADTLQKWLTQQGYPCERVAIAKGFRVLAAHAG